MLEVDADLNTLAMAGLATFETCVSWCSDLIYIMEMEAATGFQLQFKCAGRAPLALGYVVSANGTLQSSDKSGGIDYFALPAGTRATLFVSLNYQSRNIETVRAYLRLRRWTFDGEAVSGNGTQDRIYSSGGYGVVRSKLGAWQ
jgi:hypothetical protein